MHLEKIHKMIEELTDCTEAAIKNNKSKVGDYPISMVTDMIKDLSEAEYHGKITHAMDKSEDEKEEEEKYMLRQMKEEYGEDEGQKYYNDWRYANGRYAPKGRGSRRGYGDPVRYMYPEWHMDPEMIRDYDRAVGKMYYADMRNDGRSMDSMDMDRNARSRNSSRGYEDAYSRGYSDGQRNNQRDSREGKSGQMRRSYMDTKEMVDTPEAKQKKITEVRNYMKELGADIDEMLSGSSPEEKSAVRAELQSMVQKI